MHSHTYTVLHTLLTPSKQANKYIHVMYAMHTQKPKIPAIAVRQIENIDKTN